MKTSFLAIKDINSDDWDFIRVDRIQSFSFSYDAGTTRNGVEKYRYNSLKLTLTLVNGRQFSCEFKVYIDEILKIKDIEPIIIRSILGHINPYGDLKQEKIDQIKTRFMVYSYDNKE